MSDENDNKTIGDVLSPRHESTGKTIGEMIVWHRAGPEPVHEPVPESVLAARDEAEKQRHRKWREERAQRQADEKKQLAEYKPRLPYRFERKPTIFEKLRQFLRDRHERRFMARVRAERIERQARQARQEIIENVAKIATLLQNKEVHKQLAAGVDHVVSTAKGIISPFRPTQLLTVGRTTISYKVFLEGKEEEVKQKIIAMLQGNPRANLRKFEAALGITILLIDPEPTKPDDEQPDKQIWV